MGYALRLDGQGWRGVDSAADIDTATEEYVETQPFWAYRKADAVRCAVVGLGTAYTLLVPETDQEWDYDDNVWARGVKLTTVDLSLKKDAILAAGYTSGGHTYQIRDVDISNFQSVLLAFALSETNPHEGVWRDIANVNVALDDTAMRTLALAAVAYHRDVLRAWSAKKDAVKVLTTEQAETYDIDAGWPANGV